MKVRRIAFGVLVPVALALAGCGEESAQKLFDRGAVELQQGDYDQAIIHFNKGLELEPKAAVGLNLLGMAYRLKYNTLRAAEWKEKEIDAFRQAVAADSTFEPALINLGATLYYLGEKAEAATHFRRALAINPDNPEREQLEAFIQEGTEEAAPAAN